MLNGRKMQRSRTLLFYIQDHKGIYPTRFDSLKTSQTLSETLRLVLIGLSRTENLTELSQDPKDYDLHCWSLQGLLDSKIVVGKIPKPGIVIAIRRTLGDTYGRAFGIKTEVTMSQDHTQRSFLDSFLSEIESQSEPNRTRFETVPRKEISEGWSTQKIVYASAYATSCTIVDMLLLPVLGGGIVGLIAVELGVLFGFPKLVEWLRK